GGRGYLLTPFTHRRRDGLPGRVELLARIVRLTNHGRIISSRASSGQGRPSPDKFRPFRCQLSPPAFAAARCPYGAGAFVVLVRARLGPRERGGVMTMRVSDMGRQSRAEGVRSAGERRRADEQAGRMAAEASRLWQRSLPRPARALRALRA